jgi:NADH:quinone reductase (non-electrogenic)
VTLVSPDSALVVWPRLYEARPETLAVELLPLLRKVDAGFVSGEAIRLDTAAKAVTLAVGDCLAYDRLVVATGSRIRRPQVPGAEAAFSVDTRAEAIAFDRRLDEIARGVAEPTVAIVGAGFTGIELALELRDRLKAHGADGGAEHLHIVLIDQAETVGPELGPGPGPRPFWTPAASVEPSLVIAGVQKPAQ